METICLATIWPRNPLERSEVFVLEELLREYGAHKRDWILRVVVASAHNEALDVAHEVMVRFPNIRADLWWMETEHAGTRPEEISYCKEQLLQRLAAEPEWDWLFLLDADVWTRIAQVPEWIEHIGVELDACFVKIKYTHRVKMESPTHTLGAYFHHRALLERLKYWKIVFPRLPDGKRRNAPDCLLNDFLRRQGCRKVVPDSMATLHFTDTQNARVFAGGESFDATGVRNGAGAWSGGAAPMLSPVWERLDAPADLSISPQTPIYGKVKPRTEILNTLVRTRGLRSYLEIGTRNPAANYLSIRCAKKTGVNPAPLGDAPGIVRMRSDDFFRNNRLKSDLIFIDGDHRAEAVMRDISNGLAVLTPGGVLVMHDALPPAETFTREEDRQANGGAWEAVLHFFFQSEYQCCIVDADWGVAIVDTCKPRDQESPAPQVLPDGALSYPAYFPLLDPYRVPLDDWRITQESEWQGRE